MTESDAAVSLLKLRRFARPAKVVVEHCELCGAVLSSEHDHLLTVGTRQLHCACQACALLFSNDDQRYRRVPQRVKVLKDFVLSDVEWEALNLPINLAFFYRPAADAPVTAVYPSPAGPTESLLRLEAWDDLVAANPVLGNMATEVEALLVHRVGGTHDYFLVSIDRCYQLIGLIRLHWRGLSGGKEVWQQVARYFERLKGGPPS